MAADLHAVAAQLDDLGACVEHPGCVVIPAELEHSFWCGTANEFWGCDLMTADGKYVRTSIATGVLSTEEDATKIATALRAVFTDADVAAIVRYDIVARALTVIELDNEEHNEHDELVAELRTVVAELKDEANR